MSRDLQINEPVYIFGADAFGRYMGRTQNAYGADYHEIEIDWVMGGTPVAAGQVRFFPSDVVVPIDQVQVRPRADVDPWTALLERCRGALMNIVGWYEVGKLLKEGLESLTEAKNLAEHITSCFHGRTRQEIDADMILTKDEILYLLECIKVKEKLPVGYSKKPEVSGLQGKLSIMLQMASKVEAQEEP